MGESVRPVIFMSIKLGERVALCIIRSKINTDTNIYSVWKGKVIDAG